jgi:hypothetical protein
MYWKEKDNVFSQPFMISLMKYDRFCEIKKYIHVFDNEAFITESRLPNTNIATKLEGLIEYFNKKFKTAAHLKENLLLMKICMLVRERRFKVLHAS